MIRRRLSVHLGAFIVGAAVLRVGVVPAEVCPPVSAAAVDRSIAAATDWLIGGMAVDGSYTYGYDRVEQQINEGYNYARHGGVTMSLYQVYAATGDPGVLAAADRGLGLALAGLVEHSDWIAWQPEGDIPVGANGLLGAALSIRRTATGDPEYDDTMRGIARFLAQQQQPDGSIYAYWDVRAERPSEVFGPFATGEAAWALALIDRHFPDQGWGETAAHTLLYMGTERNLTEGYLTSLPDHWAAYALADLRPELLTAELVEYGRRLAGYFGVRLRFEAQRRGTGINLAVRWYPGPPAGVGTAGEGIGALRRLAANDPRASDLLNPIDQRLVCMAGFMADRQVAPAEADSPLESGAWFYRGYTQMDDQQHVLSAMLAARQTMKEQE